MKRLVSIIASILAAGVFAACAAEPGSGHQENDVEAGELKGSLIVGVPSRFLVPYKKMAGAFNAAHRGLSLEIVPLEQAWDNVEDDTRKARNEAVICEVSDGNGLDLYIGGLYQTGIYDDVAQDALEGRFLDLSPYLDGLYETNSFYSAVLSSGKFDGHQYVVPLSFQMVGLLAESGADAERLQQEKTAAQALEYAISLGSKQDTIALLPLIIRPDVFSTTPIIDYGTGDSASIDEFKELFRTTSYINNNAQGDFDILNSLDRLPTAENPVFGDVIGKVGGLEKRALWMWSQSCAPEMIPLRNAQGGVNAMIAYYAVVDARCKSPEIAAAFITEVLLSDEIQGLVDGPKWGVGYAPQAIFDFTLPVRRDALGPSLDYSTFSGGGAPQAEYPEEVVEGLDTQIAKVTGGIFYTYEAKTIEKAVYKNLPNSNGDIGDLEQILTALKERNDLGG